MTPQYARVDGEGQFMLTFPGSRGRASAVDLSGSFTGMIEAKIADRARSFPATVTFVQKGSDLSGTWTTSFSSGQMTGIVDSLAVRAFQVNQTLPCARVFHGTATADSSHNVLAGAYNGIECDGTLFTSTFRLNRIDAVRLEESRLALPDYLNIGLSYLYQDRPDEALGYLHKARQLAEASRDDGYRVQALVFIAIAQDYLKHTADAVDYFEQSLRLAQERDNLPIQRYALRRLGVLEQQQGHAQNSRAHLERALTLSEHAQDEAEQARVLYFLGVLAAGQSRADEARERFDKAVSIAERLNLPELAQIRQARDSVPRP